MRTSKLLAHLALLAGGFVLGIGATVFWQQHQAGSVGSRVSSPDTRHPTPDAPRTWYTCGMHPEVVQDHPGNCPKCGMKLQPMSHDRAVSMGLVQQDEATDDARTERKILYWKSSMIPGEIHKEPGKDAMGMDLVPVYADEAAVGSTIRIDPVTEQNMGIRVDKVIRGPLVKAVRTVGFVDYDETTLASVTTKVSGWIEKLYVDQTGRQVHAGDPLFDLYSPELFSAQQEYLAALRNLPGKNFSAFPGSRLDSEALISDARTRLEYFDISPEQIRELERTRKVRKTMTIRAPFTGIVTHKNVVEGERVMAGKDLFRIADISTVWVIAKVFEYDVPYVQVGQEALITLSYLPDKTFRGRVTYVYPYLDAQTRVVSVRMEFHNPGYELKPGMYANATLQRQIASESTLVPDVAVINTGLRSVAFVMSEPGRFEPREVQIGARAENNYLQVLSGLAPGETVVVSGQFLLDSESRLREAALKLTKPGVVDGATPIQAATKSAGHAHWDAGAPQEGTLYFVCPMPEHVDILYTQAGTCPLCGMDLVPTSVRPDQSGKLQTAYWTCPMPEHAGVQESGPGKCPICGMSLVLVSEAPKSEQAAALPTTTSEGEKKPEDAVWTCPMPEHSSVREARPGQCPICGMNLVPKED